MERVKELTHWSCECEQRNPLYARKCLKCGKEVPGTVSDKVHKEMFMRYRVIFREEAFQKSVQRCGKKCKRLNKLQIINILLALTLFLVIIGLEFYYNGGEIRQCIVLNADEHARRFGDEMVNIILSRGNIFKVLPSLVGNLVVNPLEIALGVAKGILELIYRGLEKFAYFIFLF